MIVAIDCGTRSLVKDATVCQASPREWRRTGAGLDRTSGAPGAGLLQTVVVRVSLSGMSPRAAPDLPDQAEVVVVGAGSPPPTAAGGRSAWDVVHEQFTHPVVRSFVLWLAMATIQDPRRPGTGGMLRHLERFAVGEPDADDTWLLVVDQTAVDPTWAPACSSWSGAARVASPTRTSSRCAPSRRSTWRRTTRRTSAGPATAA